MKLTFLCGSEQKLRHGGLIFHQCQIAILSEPLVPALLFKACTTKTGVTCSKSGPLEEPCFIIQFSVDQDPSDFYEGIDSSVDPLSNRFPRKSSRNLFPSIAPIFRFRSSSSKTRFLRLKLEDFEIFIFIL
jgi:hypothetical protein